MITDSSSELKFERVGGRSTLLILQEVGSRLTFFLNPKRARQWSPQNVFHYEIATMRTFSEGLQLDKI